MFKHKMGVVMISKTTGLKGIVNARSENLYGCNRYYLQPRVDSNNKIPDGCWFDEEDLLLDKKAEPLAGHLSNFGGPISRIK